MFTSVVEMVSFLVLGSIATGVAVYYLIVGFRCLQTIHRLRGMRAAAGFILSMLGLVLVIWLISLPLQQSIYTSFRSQGNN